MLFFCSHTWGPKQKKNSTTRGCLKLTKNYADPKGLKTKGDTFFGCCCCETLQYNILLHAAYTFILSSVPFVVFSLYLFVFFYYFILNILLFFSCNASNNNEMETCCIDTLSFIQKYYFCFFSLPIVCLLFCSSKKKTYPLSLKGNL